MKHAILMSDVVGSMRSDAEAVRSTLATITREANARFRDVLLSPLTVTLGDEFQSIASDFQSALEIAFWVDEASRRAAIPVKLRFSVVYGEVATPLNTDIAHGMIGEGLQIARQLITTKTRDKLKYQARTGQVGLDAALNDVLYVLATITNSWKPKDYALIDAMIHESNDSQVGAKFDKLRQQIYKRRKTLMIKDYHALKRVALTLAGEV